MARPTSPCPFYGMPCQYVPMAHRTDELEQENAKLRAAALEEAAKLVDYHAAAYEACMSRGDDDGTLEAVAASLRGRAANIRALKNQNPDSAALGGEND